MLASAEITSIDALTMAHYVKLWEKYYNLEKTDSLPLPISFGASRVRMFVEGVTLGLRYFVYSGATYERSNSFCRYRDGNVYSVDELLSWADIPDRPKVEGYDPVFHLGSTECFEGEEHCNHILRFIPNFDALRRRPHIQHRGILMRSLEDVKSELTQMEKIEMLSYRLRTYKRTIGVMDEYWEYVLLILLNRVILNRKLRAKVSLKAELYRLERFLLES